MSAQFKDGLAARLGMEGVIDNGAGGKSVLAYRATMDMCHSGGIVQGGFITGWIDAAMAHAVLGASGYTLSPLSLEIKISFLRSAGPGLYHAEAWIERQGKSTVFLEGRLLNEAGEVVAKGSSTAKLVKVSADNRKVEAAIAGAGT